MRVLGIDPGQRHLGLCLIETGPTPADDSIVFWKCHAITAATPKYVPCVTLIKDLDEILGDLQIDEVVIERQPPKNSSMKRMESLLEMYVAARIGVPVYVMDARNKLIFAATTPHWDPTTKISTYAQRKRASIDVATKFLTANQSDSARALFEGSTKRDDLADSLLTAQSFAHLFRGSMLSDALPADPHHMPKSRAPVSATSRITASNVVHLLKACDTIEQVSAVLKGNARLQKAVCKYFDSPEAFVERKKVNLSKKKTDTSNAASADEP